MLLCVMSPSKTQAVPSSSLPLELEQPRFRSSANKIIRQLKSETPETLQTLMLLSPALAEKTFTQIQAFSTGRDPKNTFAAAFLYQGDAFLHLHAPTWSHRDFHWAQSHLSILSALYGILKPLDCIQPYRLDLNTMLALDDHPNLITFWKGKVTKYINASEATIVVNLASAEFSKLLDRKALKSPVVDFSFKTRKNGKLQSIGLHAKQARGAMARAFIKQRIESVHQFSSIPLAPYEFDASQSSDTLLCFVRS